MTDKMKTKNVIMYLISKLGGQIEGRKKFMKLMFLIEHFDTEGEKLVKNRTLGNGFFIYYYGVFSRDVMESYTELVKEGKLKPGFHISIQSESGIRLEQKLMEKVDKIVEKFGESTGYYLETETLKMLGIEPSKKDSYFGKEVEEIITS